MIRKIVLGVLFASVSGALIYGGIYRTAARLETGNRRAVSSQRSDDYRLEHELRSGGINRNESDSDSSGNQGSGKRGSEITSEKLSVEIDEITLEGTVADYSADRLTVMTINGQEFFVENRAWWFAQQAGFAVNIGDRIELSGFFDESGFFEVSQLMNLINGININIRDESGRPYWAGNGGGGGQGRRSG